MAPTEKDPIMPPTLKMATAKLHTTVFVPERKGSPYRSSDTLWKNVRSFYQTPEKGGKRLDVAVFNKPYVIYDGSNSIKV